MSEDAVEVIIVGAGLSGIGAAYHLQQNCPGKRYTILEAREDIGGTWDLFRYPGIRSDSDMHTLGYNFKPWRADKAIADGPSILSYVKETAAENGIDKHIRFGQKVVAAAWNSDSSTWSVSIEDQESGTTSSLRCNFLLMCAGYYNYDQGYTPEFPGRENFKGEIVHPQQWPENLDYSNKNVVVIGSGATAMTLVPAMSDRASKVVMLQRSPTYVFSAPDKDAIANFLRKILPDSWAYAITRWKNVSLQQWAYKRTRTRPEFVKRRLINRVRKHLGPDYDVEKHFTPQYNPWDQRLCLVPNEDLFESIRNGKAEVVTEHIDYFAEDGIVLKNGEKLAADIIVTATGLNLSVLAGMSLTVDNQPVDLSSTWTYKGLMTTEVPNLVTTFGYINASWTLRADLTSEWVCRLLNHMDAIGARKVLPTLRAEDADMPAGAWIQDFSSGYMERMMHAFPRQGDREPWLNPQSYGKDKKMFRQGSLDDGALVYSSPESRTQQEESLDFAASSA